MARTVASLAAVVVAVTLAPGVARAQDTRRVREPREPAACVTLAARLAAPGGALSDADEAAPDTARIQAAIDGCPAGKAVKLAAGAGGENVFLAAPLRLTAGVTLVVAPGVALFASRNPRDYDVTPGSCGVVADARQKCLPFISADDAPGAGVMGGGAVDGRGGARLLGVAPAVTWWGLARQAKVEDRFQACPKLIAARRSNGFVLHGVTLRNAAQAHVLVEQTDGFTAWGVKIKTPRTARNTDGINPQSSSNVTITRCSIDTGDDNVAIKAGALGPVKHVTISHNHFYAGHGMSIGSETLGGVSAVSVVDLTLDGTDRGLRIKSDRSRGGVVEDVSYDDVCMRNVGDPILLDTRYTQFPGDKIPVYRRISFKDVHSLTPGALSLLGMDEQNRIDVAFDNVTVAEPVTDLRAEHAQVRIGPRRGSFVPKGAHLVDVVVSGADGARPGKPVDCRARFVPFPAPAPGGAPAAAVEILPEDRTLYVAASGSGDFYTLQRAVDLAPASGGAVINVGPGTYRERLVIAKPGIVLRGARPDAREAVIVEGASAGTAGSGFKSATVEVRPPAAGFRAENLTFMNDFNRTHQQQPKGSQALALLVAADRAVFRNVRLIGDQDTLYAGSSDCTPPGHDPRACTLTRQYFEGCFIEGNVDFIYGNSTAVFSRCEIRSNPHSIGYVTANGRQSADEPSLFVFDHCKLTADPGVAHVWLGRPWRPFARVVFLDTEMGAHIEPAGWREWHPGETDYMKTVFYAERGSTGPGASPAARDPHTKKLTAEEAAAYQTRRVLAGGDGWDPAASAPAAPAYSSPSGSPPPPAPPAPSSSPRSSAR